MSNFPRVTWLERGQAEILTRALSHFIANSIRLASASQSCLSTLLNEQHAHSSAETRRPELQEDPGLEPQLPAGPIFKPLHYKTIKERLHKWQLKIQLEVELLTMTYYTTLNLQAISLEQLNEDRGKQCKSTFGMCGFYLQLEISLPRFNFL